MRRLSILVLAALSFSLGNPVASARDESEDPGERERITHVGGRTLDAGRRMFFASLGWPGLGFGGYFSPGEAFDVGLAGRLLAGSPLMGLDVGAGLEAGVPMRLRLITGEVTNGSLEIRPFALVGRASLTGLSDPFDDELGSAFGGEARFRLGFALNPKMSLGLGAGGQLAFTLVPDVDDGDQLVGTAFGTLGLESLLTRAIVFFVEVDVGYGFRPDPLFEDPLVLRGGIGFALTIY